ncbi:hypothetical protein LTR96_002796 [Exophiala xenobiotica]|nr:hypothetical protein LTR92_005332 [Exophiala xenobiotica]KAK5273164.1 hypothetical protein LTR96_002796 [Exophiala xenobiotica]KAK5341159.1 hypothetical protein LTR98_001951 [Exophiala xenobiotica]KAK5443711.1 hypothetical protein LTR18_004972 [Exophiala xenobiotica]KAK5559000.1 hypothetical protein LTR46_003189 [Exophiala xenobiotica]
MSSAADSGTEEEISRLQEKNERLRDDLLTLLHQPQDQATDGSIREDFRHLCQSIDFWVDNVVEHSSLEKYGVKLGRREQDLLKEVDIISLARRSETATAYLLLSVAVQKELQKNIFDRPCPVGITKQQESVIEQVLQGMQTLEFGKEQVTRNRWRSEAVRALTAHKDFGGSQETALRLIVETATDFISPRSGTPICGLSYRAFQKHSDTLYNDIFRVAMELHQSLRCSLHQYTVKPPKIDVDMNGEQMAEMGWGLKDVDSWQDLRRGDPTAQPICSLYPSIMRESDRRGDMQTIVPAVVVVESKNSKVSGQSSPVQSTRPSPAHSSSETARNREKRRGPEYTHADSTRSRDLSRSTELPNPPDSMAGNGFLKYLAMAMSRSETHPTAKQKPPGKEEATLNPGVPREYRTTKYVSGGSREGGRPKHIMVMEESDVEVIQLPRDRTSPERYRHELRGSQHQDDSPRR